ncbi:af-9 [Hyphodiscus hymeniophilus]|uniref:Protein AF-9 homolog n=1 Tax=Hyphodiscus hymeniophilus TaxID=353542 RepID=A0A9P6VGK7_9HELO|nr:af-9 [Hyphodiscus hymeniophilus]
MAPPNTQKRIKGVSVFRPFVYGTTARPFDPVTNPKPEGVSADHTHSWTVFVKGVDDTDITYWCKKVQFKLHESIPNHVRTIENIAPGETFEVHETGWGEFEISIKIFYVPESLEKPQTMYHQLRLHTYGTEAEKEEMRRKGEIKAWGYEEMVFNEPGEGEGHEDYEGRHGGKRGGTDGYSAYEYEARSTLYQGDGDFGD